MSTQETSLSAFFSAYHFQGYTYDRSNNPEDEFVRLCIARQWGRSKRRKEFKRYRLALQEYPSSPLEVFFDKHWVPHFTYKPLANKLTQFGRLQMARQWEGTELEDAKKEYRAAVWNNAAPIVKFLRGGEVSGYRFGSGRAELEFEKLLEAHKCIWEQKRSKKGGDVGKKKRRIRWRDSTEFKRLHAGFYGAVEEQFDYMLDEISYSTGLRRDVALAELFQVGNAPMSKAEAKTVRLHPNSP